MLVKGVETQTIDRNMEILTNRSLDEKVIQLREITPELCK